MSYSYTCVLGSKDAPTVRQLEEVAIKRSGLVGGFVVGAQPLSCGLAVFHVSGRIYPRQFREVYEIVYEAKDFPDASRFEDLEEAVFERVMSGVSESTRVDIRVKWPTDNSGHIHVTLEILCT